MIFESILTEAAEKSKAQEARALAIEKQRHEELYGDVGQRKVFPKVPQQKSGKKGRAGIKGASYLNPRREYIMSEHKKGTKTKFIAECLGEKGVRVGPKYLSYYIWKEKQNEENN